MSLLESLSDIVGQAFEAAGFDASLGAVVFSDTSSHGQFQCNGALAGAKRYGANPRQMAEQVVEHLSSRPELQAVGVAGPGFINLSVTDAFLSQSSQSMAADARLGIAPVDQPYKLFIDFAGLNIAKPMHVGHLRSTIIGDSLQRLYRFLGIDVVSDVHLGDWGTQMGMVIRGVERDHPDLPYFDPSFEGPYPEESPVSLSDLDAIYPRESALSKADPAERARALQAILELQAGRPGYLALWRHFVAVSLVGLRQNIDWLGVHFDEWNGESHYNDAIPAMIERLKERGYAEQSEGALVVFLEDPLPPLMLLKSDGAYLYGTTDMATVEERVSQGADRIVYVVDSRQELHFRQVFAAARRTKIAPEGLAMDFLGFGTMNSSDGKPFKTRAGGVMRLDELIELIITKARERMTEAGIAGDYPAEERELIAQAVGKAALKFADLINNRSSDYIFDLDRFSSFEGKTGPYIIYTGVRIKSIFRKAGESGGTFSQELSDPERNLLLVAAALPEAVWQAYEFGTPNVLCEHAFVLCQAFNRFYQECNITREENAERKSSWLATSALALAQLELIAQLIGIDIPERM